MYLFIYGRFFSFRTFLQTNGTEISNLGDGHYLLCSIFNDRAVREGASESGVTKFNAILQTFKRALTQLDVEPCLFWYEILTPQSSSAAGN